jgi:pyruvate/2-oxoglutarate dehydrogenase complex dihydrolipoamide dehydrogenase (E3) component/uncharacterized membrane protein YdjX (TVP38/TMEM64 family)
MMNAKKIIIAVVLVALIAAWFLLDLQNYFTLEYFQARRQDVSAYKEAHFWLSSLLYFGLYVFVAALSLPAAAILTVIGGALFGFWWGLVLVSFASSIGATLAFLLARTILRDWVQNRFGSSLQAVDKGVAKDGALYLFTLRLVPLFPFFLVNVLMGLTSIRPLTFYVVSQLGMLFGTALYVNLGAQLGVATSLPGILSIGVIRAIAALAIFPWAAKVVIKRFRTGRQLRAYARPSAFDTNMVVIGAGSAGLVTSYIAALLKAHVTLIEKHRMGGDCLYTGCVPSKALLRSASVRHLIKRAGEFGLQNAAADVDFAAVMQRVKKIIITIAPHDSAVRYEALGVDCIEGAAKITSPYTVAVNDKVITTRNIVIATGARPVVPAIPGVNEIAYVTSETIWNLVELPRKFLVLGGGPIGCELAQAFARLGSEVTLVYHGDRLLPKEDPDVSRFIAEVFEAEGICLLGNCEVKSFHRAGNNSFAKIQNAQGNSDDLEFAVVLLATGRKANIEGLGLEELGINTTASGAIDVNEYLQTSYPNIFACGDVAGPYQFTHMAAFQAWFASVNSLFGTFKKFKVSYRVVPWTTFVDPQVARVGLNEAEAQANGIAYELTRYAIDDLDRAIAEGENRGFVKVLTAPGKDKILGATIVGYQAAELLTEFTFAMTHGLGLKKIQATIHVYPTLSESNKYAAGEWRRSHAPKWLYPWLEKFHRYMRGA